MQYIKEEGNVLAEKFKENEKYPVILQEGNPCPIIGTAKAINFREKLIDSESFEMIDFELDILLDLNDYVYKLDYYFFLAIWLKKKLE